jgi:hypothetical protein
MRLGDEGVQAMEWAYGLLSASQPLADALGVSLEALPDRVWPDPAPGDTVAPFVVFSPAESLDHQALGPRARIYTTVPLIVKGLDEARNYDRLAPVARAIYATLVARENDPVSEGGTILTAQRTAGIQYPERADGIEYRHLGHMLSVEIN